MDGLKSYRVGDILYQSYSLHFLDDYLGLLAHRSGIDCDAVIRNLYDALMHRLSELLEYPEGLTMAKENVAITLCKDE